MVWAKLVRPLTLTGRTTDVGILNAPSLNPTGAFSIEGWIYPLVDEEAKILAKWGDQGTYSQRTDLHFSNRRGEGSWLFDQRFGESGQCCVSGVRCRKCADFESMEPCRRDLRQRDGNSAPLCERGAGWRAHQCPGSPVYTSTTPVTIGAWLRAPGVTQDYIRRFDIDELGFYGRSLSASEIQAIYADGTNGDFNPNKSHSRPGPG